MEGVTTDVQAKAAKDNHRGYIYQMLGDLVAPPKVVTLEDVLFDQRWNSQPPVIHYDVDANNANFNTLEEGLLSPLMNPNARVETENNILGAEIVPD